METGRPRFAFQGSILKKLFLLSAVALMLGWYFGARYMVEPLGPAIETGQFRWKGASENFGGFSGLEISGDGAQITALTDRSRVFDATITRDGLAIKQIDIVSDRRLISHMDVWLDDINSDTEALAGEVDGTMYLSSEGRASVYSLQPDTNEVVWVETGDFFKELPGNQGIEAMAIDREGRLYVLPETLRRAGDTIPVFVWEDDQWREVFQIPGSQGYNPTGADFGPDGKLYVLERKYSWLFGVSNQIRRVDLTKLADTPPELILRTRYLDHGNLEGLGVWRFGDDIRLTTITDNNFWFFLPTEIVEFALPVDGAN